MNPIDRMSRWIPTLLMIGLIIGDVTWVQAKVGRKTVAFDEIDVQRINIREPDGTLRMVISNTSAAPGVMVKGKEYRHPTRSEAGIIFMNAEGTENGGLIFDGGKKNGKVYGSGHLSFDQYEQDQVISLDQGEDNGVRHATLSFNDRPDTPIPWDRSRDPKRRKGRRSSKGFRNPAVSVSSASCWAKPKRAIRSCNSRMRRGARASC